MATESEFRDQLRNHATEVPSQLDAEFIIRQAKRRRTPRQIAVGSVSALAVVGFTVLGVSVAPSLMSASTGAADSAAISSAESQFDAPEAELESGTSERDGATPGAERSLTSRCGTSTPEFVSNELGLELAVTFPREITTGSHPVEGTVTLTNTGAFQVHGVILAEPTMTVSRDGLTLWHSAGASPQAAQDVALAAGESQSFPAFFTPVDCSAADDAQLEFPQTLPAITPGAVALIAAIEFRTDLADAAGSHVIFSQPSDTVLMR